MDDEYGDIDRDGFIEYRRESAEGLVNQGWKDSFDSIFHAKRAARRAADRVMRMQG